MLFRSGPARPPEAKCRRDGWSTGLGRPPEAKCRRDGWSTGLGRPPEAKCRRDGWSTGPARPPEAKCRRDAKAGTITAPAIGELILERDEIDPDKTRILCRDIAITSDRPEWRK